MTQLVTDLLASAPATPGKTPGVSRIDGAATGSFARLLSDAELQPDTLAGEPSPEAGLLLAGDGEPLFLALPPTLVGPEAAPIGNAGEALPATGNDLPADAALAVLSGDVAALDLDAIATDAAVPAEAIAGGAPAVAHGDLAATLVEPEAALPVAAAVPPVADDPQRLAADVARTASVPVVMGESAARALRPEPLPADRTAPPAVLPTPGDEVVAPSAPIEPATRSVAAFAEAAAAESAARPDAAVRALTAEAAAGSAGQDPLARLAPLDALSSGAGRAPAIDTTVRMSIDQPVTSPAWADALSKRVLVMTDTKLRSAEIRMDPPELGPIEVHLTVKDEKAHVTFQAQHALTRDAIESALPRLREMLAEQGLGLGQATVSDQSAGESGRFSQSSAGESGVDDGAPGEADDVSPTRRAAAHAGLIDDYA